MTRKYFGTDGIRGRVGVAPITPDFVLKLGYCAGKVLSRADIAPPHRQRPTVLIGKDTRISGYMLESALESGLSAAGVDTVLVGPMPTPAVAYLVRALRLSAGIMISASHNPYEDNGIKFFSADGMKLPDAVESEIESLLDSPLVVAASAQLGKAERLHDAEGRYIEFCKGTFPRNTSLRGVKLVVDCAHGSNYRVGVRVFQELGAEVIAIGNTPNGLNINEDVGATHPKTLGKAVKEHKADFGIAFDGDGDRLAMADSGRHALRRRPAALRDREAPPRGRTPRRRRGRDAHDQLRARKAPVRDEDRLRARQRGRPLRARDALVERGWECGGENSGHLLCLDCHSTGDAIISALQVLAALVRSKQSLANYTADLRLLPQVLVNVKVDGKLDLQSASVREAVAKAESTLAGRGRVLLRASGTEPVVRVMVEGEDRAHVQELADAIAAALVTPMKTGAQPNRASV